MNEKLTAEILKRYGVDSVTEIRIIDSSRPEDYRLNIIADNRYVLRINDPVITEQRLAEIDRLAGRYCSIGVQAPRLLRNDMGNFLLPLGEHICYVSQYLDYPLLSEDPTNMEEIYAEISEMIGKFSALFTGVDLMEVNSMWSLIDLAPLDVDIDEKQENCNALVDALRSSGEGELAEEVAAFNLRNREEIKKVYKTLPRCVIQGDLNGSNILVQDGHFVGLIDFNMAGTEVNVNHFCCESNAAISEEEFLTEEAQTIVDGWRKKVDAYLQPILKGYTLSSAEETVLPYYRNICFISQYPNVCAYRHFLKLDQKKMAEILKCYMESNQ